MKTILNISDKELRELITILEEGGESYLAGVLAGNAVSAEQAHKKAIEDINERERLDMEEEDFDYPLDPIDEAVMKAYDLLIKRK